MSHRQRGEGLNTDGPPRGLLIAAVAIAAVAIAAVIGLAAVTRHARPIPVVIPALEAPQASSPECRSLLSALPERLGEYQRTAPSPPVPPGAAAWLLGGGEPVVLRCGVDRPDEFVVGAAIQVVDAVQWFQVGSTDAAPATSENAARSTWFAVDRPVYIAVTLPPGSGPTPIQQLSDVIAGRLTAVPIRPGPPA